MKCPIFRTLSMVLVAGAVLGITGFAAADLDLDSSGWEYQYNGDIDPVPDALGGYEVGGTTYERETIPPYNISPSWGGLSLFEGTSDGDILDWRFGKPRPGDGIVQYDVILEHPDRDAASDREGGWAWQMRFHIPDNDHNQIFQLTDRDSFHVKLLSGDNPNDAGTSFRIYHDKISQGSHTGSGAEPQAFTGNTDPKGLDIVAEEDFKVGFHTFTVAQPPASDDFELYLDGDFLGHARRGALRTVLGDGCTGACGHIVGGSDSFTRGELQIDYIRATGSYPEPASLGLLGIGSLMMLRRRR